jgi:hypothetical protein
MPSLSLQERLGSRDIRSATNLPGGNRTPNGFHDIQHLGRSGVSEQQNLCGRGGDW